MIFSGAGNLICETGGVFLSLTPRFVMYHCFVGFSLNTENLSGDFFVNFMIGGLVDFPAYTIALLFSKRIGRKTLYIVGMTVAGASLLASTAVTVLTTGLVNSIY